MVVQLSYLLVNEAEAKRFVRMVALSGADTAMYRSVARVHVVIARGVDRVAFVAEKCTVAHVGRRQLPGVR